MLFIKKIEILTRQEEKLKRRNSSLEKEKLELKQKVDNLTSTIEELKKSLNTSQPPICLSPKTKSKPDLDQTAIDNNQYLNTVDMGTSVFWKSVAKAMKSYIIFNYNTKYPPKEKINMTNVFQEIINDCLPREKVVFEDDKIVSSRLDLDKLNKILSSEYMVKPITKREFEVMTFKDLKYRIVSLLAG